jgi:hypothetical protein
MTVTELLGYEAKPPAFASHFLLKIRDFVPVVAFLREGSCPVGSYLVPFVDRRGDVLGWVVFASRFASQTNQNCVFVRLDFPNDPTRIYRVVGEGVLEIALKTINEDW